MESTQGRQSGSGAAGRPSRGQWRTQYDFILTCIGKTVGLSNIWRFPYLSLRYGGSAFLIPYFIMLFGIGVPLYVLELVLGQYNSLGPRQLFQRMSPLFSGIGTAMLIVLTFTVFTYNLAVTWTIFFAMKSFSSELEWSRCGHEYNTANCFTIADNKRCQEQSGNLEIFWNNTCFSRTQLADHHNVSLPTRRDGLGYTEADAGGFDAQSRRASSSEEFFFNYVLGLGNNAAHSSGTLRWDISLCMLFAWLLVGVCIFKGITSLGRVLHFTVIFPYFGLILLLLPLATFDGVREGMQFYGTPDFSQLWNPAMWFDAASQIFYSLGVSHGDLIMLASFNRFNNNCVRDAIIVSLIDTLTSALSLLVVISMLGVTAKHLGRPMQDVFAPDMGLAFVAFPEALVHMPVPPVFSALFFIMLITLGLDSQLIMVEVLVIATVDEWPALQQWKSWLSAGICCMFFLANLGMCWDGGVLVFALVDHYAFSFSQFALALLEVLAAAWVFGADRIVDLMRTDMAIPLPAPLRLYWCFCWRYVVPVVMLAVLGITLVLRRPASFTASGLTQTFPAWADGVGLVLMLGPAVLALVVALGQIAVRWKAGGHLAELTQPTADWGPARQTQHDNAREVRTGQAESSNAGRTSLGTADLARIAKADPALLSKDLVMGDIVLPARNLDRVTKRVLPSANDVGRDLFSMARTEPNVGFHLSREARSASSAGVIENREMSAGPTVETPGGSGSAASSSVSANDCCLTTVSHGGSMAEEEHPLGHNDTGQHSNTRNSSPVPKVKNQTGDIDKGYDNRGFK